MRINALKTKKARKAKISETARYFFNHTNKFGKFLTTGDTVELHLVEDHIENIGSDFCDAFQLYCI